LNWWCLCQAESHKGRECGVLYITTTKVSWCRAGAQTQIPPRTKLGPIKLPEGRIMTLTQQWWYLNLIKKHVLHLISCEKHREL